MTYLKLMKICVVLMVLFLAFSYPCPRFDCVDNLVPSIPNICVIRQNSTLAHLAFSCPPSYQNCPLDEYSSVVRCVSSSQGKKVPGDKVDSPTDCFSGQADSNSICTGKQLGDSCSSDVECEVGSFCNIQTNKCDPLIELGFSCNENAKCQPYLTCYLGKCVNFGSVNEGEKVGANGTALNCKTQYMNLSSRICGTGPKLISEMFHTKNNIFCKYELNGTTIIGYPSCGYSRYGHLICREKEGGLEQYWNTVLVYTRKSPKCHVTHPFGICARAILQFSESEYVDTIKAYYLMNSTIHPQLQEVPSCVKRWKHRTFWELEAVPSSANIGISLFLGFLLILF